MPKTTPKSANTNSEAQGQQQEYRDGDGVGVVESSTRARQGFWDSRIVIVLAVSIGLAVGAYVILQMYFGADTSLGQ